ncbi:MAG: hypothetical protein JW869_00805 [Candidatus Omnitrophica bacterium]|nr:hypothetical protein [Candidatus Omnitrophota bacterium]
MRKLLFCALALCVLSSLAIPAGARDIEEEMQHKRARLRAKTERLILAILRTDHPAIVDNTYYEGFSSSKGYKIDEFLKQYHGDRYTCAEIEIMTVEVFPGPTERAEVTVRAHLAVTPPHDVPPMRIDVWEFVNKQDDWFLVLRK